MTTMTREAPAFGEIPEFDAFVDERLGDCSDFIADELHDAGEMVEYVSADKSEFRAEMGRWWENRLSSLRDGFWLEWIGAQIAPPRPSRKDRITRLKRTIVRERRQTQKIVNELQGELAQERYLNEALQLLSCRECGSKPFDQYW